MSELPNATTEPPDSLESSIPCLKPYWQEKYKSLAARYWNDFYKRNTTNFFKDRHWLDHEFPGLLTRPNTTGMEVGCGVGNLIFPALERNSSLKLFACDFSETAIRLVKEHAEYPALVASDRVDAFVSDITSSSPFPANVRDLDFITSVFVLSAIAPASHVHVLQQFRDVMKVDGVICFRDYATGDLAQLRFQRAKEVPKLQNHLYVRQDGTMSYFFSSEYFHRLVDSVQGLFISSIDIVERRTTNVKQNLDEARYFLQAVIRRTA